MKIPPRPPDLDALLTDCASSGRILDVMVNVKSTGLSGKYLHWDKLRYYPPPGELTHKEWWCGLKMRRRLSAKPTSLVDGLGIPFTYTMPDPLPELLHLADSETRGNLQVSYPIVNPDEKKYYLVRSLIEEATTSSQLEGANTQLKVAKEMIRQGRAPKTNGERMILNNYYAMEHVREFKDQPLTEGLVFEIHRMVTEGTLDQPSGAGRLRLPEEEIVVSDIEGQVLHEPPPAAQLPARLANMCAFANGRVEGEFVHPVIRAMILHFWLAYDHPFIDGNGRTARILFYWSMLRQGYWLFEYIPISRVILQGPSKYLLAYLRTETDDNDLTYFLLYHADVIRRAIADLHIYLNRRIARVKEAIADLRGLTGMNHRQRDLIQHALRHPDQVYTVESHRMSHGVTYETARSDLMDLVGRGLVTKRKSGRTGHFVPVPDLDARLRA